MRTKAILASALLATTAIVSLVWSAGVSGLPDQRHEPDRVCVGMAVANLRSESPVITRVYRVFSDGTIESFDDGPPDAKWRTLGE